MPNGTAFNLRLSLSLLVFLFPFLTRGASAQGTLPTWTDKATSLVWTQQTSGDPDDWDFGVRYCKALDSGGDMGTGWRLPTMQELTSLWQGSHFKGGIKLRRTGSTVLWTSNIEGSNAQTFTPGDSGATLGILPKKNATTAVVLCVRPHHFWEK